MSILWLLVIVLAASFGQILLKMSVHGDDTSGSINWLMLATNKYFIGGVCLYAMTSVAWMWALRSYPLSRAYPMLALTFILVPLLANIFFGERLRPVDWVGMFLILAGVIVINGTRAS